MKRSKILNPKHFDTKEYEEIRALLRRKMDETGLVAGATPKKSGKFVVRLPRSLHAALEREAETEGTSLNQLVVTKLAVQLGAESLKFNPVVHMGRAVGMSERDETLGFEEILELARFVRGELQERTPIRLILATPLALYTVRELTSRGLDGACHVRHILGILGSGEMAVCGIGRTIPELCFGNLAETSVADVWLNHPVLHRLRQDLDGEYPGVCGRCIHAKRCLTWCVAQNYQEAGQLVAPAWMCDQAYERGVFPKGRLREAQ